MKSNQNLLYVSFFSKSVFYLVGAWGEIRNRKSMLFGARDSSFQTHKGIVYRTAFEEIDGDNGSLYILAT